MRQTKGEREIQIERKGYTVRKRERKRERDWDIVRDCIKDHLHVYSSLIYIIHIVYT